MSGENISHYKIFEKVGEGGMGVVYKAEDTRLKRTVALKFLPKELTRDQEARERFKMEAQAAAALNNPNIVIIHEIDEHEGDIYIAMEYVEGETLRDKMPHVWDQQQDTPRGDLDPHKTREIFPPVQQEISPEPMKTRDAVDIAIQVCKGLKATHKLGIIHRDIKPQNIIISEEGVVKILDFGVAKLTRGTNATKEFATIGTVHYMSPEQLTGKEVDQRTDIWSLGVVLYEMLTTKLPFLEDDMHAIMYAIVNDNPPPPSELSDDIPREMERIILRCLRKEREERYASVESLLGDLIKVEKIMQKDSRELKLKKKAAARKETERRYATILSAEITGYNKMMEEMDAEDLAAVMSDYFDMFNAVAVKYEGIMDKTSGSGFRVLFGVPEAVENAPIKAVYTAVEMRSQIEQYNRQKKPDIPIGIRIGINTGMVIAGILGKDEEKYSVLGDTVNLANQLRDISPEGKIYVGPLTHKTTREKFEYRELKPVAHKGKKEGAAGYELVSVKEKTTLARLGSERMIFAEMVGRNKELDKLQLHLMKVINGEGSIINIIGEPGIGKSRLIAEFRKNETFKRVTILEGRALSIGKNISFHPLIDIIKNWFKINEKDSAAEAYNKLKNAVEAIYPAGAEEIFPFIATLMGMKPTGQYAKRVEGIEGDALEKLIKINFRELIKQAAGQKPIVFIVQDLHWADMSTIELLESIFRLVKENPIMFLNVFRPGYQETGEQLLTTIMERYPKFYRVIHLESLNNKQTEQLIAGLLKVKGLPESITHLITARTGGNPFFIEEVIRSFIDNEVVELKNGHFKVTDKIDSVVIPETITDVVMGRIDKLEEETRSLLKVASVIGRNFFYKILVEVAADIDEIENRLEYLKEMQFIRERRRTAELEYTFMNILIQEAAYESILLKKRKELHGEVAAAIERVFAEKLREFYGMLALHYSLGENATKAEEYLTKAGEEALKAAASSEALHYYREALKLYLEQHGDAGDPDTIANLEKNIATALYNKGLMVETVEHCNKALRLWGEKLPKNKVSITLKLVVDLIILLKSLYFPGKKKKKVGGKRANDIIDITLKRGTALSTLDNYRMFVNSVEILGKLRKLDLAKVPLGAPMYIQGSILFSFIGKFGISKKLLEYPREYINSGDPKAIFDYKYGKLMLGFLSGNWKEEPEHDEGVVDICLRLGDIFPAIVYLLWRGILLLERGDFGGSKKCSDKLLEIGEVYEHDYSLAVAYLVSSRRLLKMRKLPGALSDAEAGFNLTSKIAQNLMSLNSKGLEANIRLLQGDIAGAEQALQQAEKIAAREKFIVAWHISSFHLSRFLYDIYQLNKSIREGDKTTIKEYRKKAFCTGKIALKNTRNYASNRPEVYRYMGVYYWLIGKQKKALSWFEKSAAVGEQMAARSELARTYRETGDRLLEEQSRFKQLNNINPGEYLEKAQALYRELGLDWDVDCLLHHC